MDKLLRDIDIITAMAAEIDDYLMSDVLFWRLRTASMPRLTLGGYLMRQHRLLALENLLDSEQQNRLEAAIIQFNRSLEGKIVLFEQKAHRELEARFRQWGEYLKDIDRGIASSRSNYSTAVEVRAMISAIVAQLELEPYEMVRRIPEQVTLLDRQLRRFWQAGDFTWPEEWQPAYPREAYWWLYGQPKEKNRKGY